MAYAGALCLLQTYKLAKIESDYKLMDYNNELLEATQKSGDVNNLFSTKLADLKGAQARALNMKGSDDATNMTRVLEEVNGEEFSFSANNMEALEKQLEAEIDKVTAEQQQSLAEINADEQVWQSKVDNEQATNALLQTNIDNCQKMVENNIASSHTYGYNS